MPADLEQNVMSWMVQIAVIVTIGGFLPKLLRLRHPRSQLIYCYLLLVGSIALPFLQPWHHQLVVGGASPLPVAAAGSVNPAAALAGGFSWRQLVLLVLVGGMLLKLCRFALGFCRLHQYRRNSLISTSLPKSVDSARRLVPSHAVVAVSKHDVGPVTFGFFRPVVLLPQSFLSMDEDAQRAIVCHELLHVKRNDWLATVVEELVGVVLWFHPAVWWLLNRIKLAREQVVDAEVIRRTAALESYVDALLTIAVGPSEHPIPAPLFLRSRHLLERMRSLVNLHHVSRFRIISSYTVIIASMAVVAPLACVSFPLIGQPQFVQPAEAGPNPMPVIQRVSGAGPVLRVGDDGVTAPRLLTQVQPQYSDAARLSRIEGSVILEGIVESDGFMSVTRVAKGLDPELDHNAKYALQQWRFAPARLNGAPVRVALTVEVQFDLM